MTERVIARETFGHVAVEYVATRDETTGYVARIVRVTTPDSTAYTTEFFDYESAIEGYGDICSSYHRAYMRSRFKTRLERIADRDARE